MKNFLSLLFYNLSFLFRGHSRERLIERSIASKPSASPALGRTHLLSPPLKGYIADRAMMFLLSRAARVWQNRSNEKAWPPFFFQMVKDWPDSRAQLFQDIWALSELDGKRDGFFVEFGATDGLEKSNSYLLEKKYGWGGILAEPNPDWHQSLRANRPGSTIVEECVWKETGQTLHFQIADNAELAGVVSSAQTDRHNRNIMRTISVQTISLIDLLKRHDAPAEIDLLSIDTEGSEVDILAAYPFETGPKFRLIAVEHNYIQEKIDALDALLEPWGYQRVLIEHSAFDAWYVRNRDAN
ncbi:FkbM family methyltransferase [Parasphingorhabdus sp.]|uniref:FkbM family methyltransferase n=1 Tax=Parasphingorhabdus sp. TaxID=2709688 RepID=UPI003BAFE4E6